MSSRRLRPAVQKDKQRAIQLTRDYSCFHGGLRRELGIIPAALTLSVAPRGVKERVPGEIWAVYRLNQHRKDFLSRGNSTSKGREARVMAYWETTNKIKVFFDVSVWRSQRAILGVPRSPTSLPVPSLSSLLSLLTLLSPPLPPYFTPHPSRIHTCTHTVFPQ